MAGKAVFQIRPGLTKVLITLDQGEIGQGLLLFLGSTPRELSSGSTLERFGEKRCPLSEG